MIQLMNESELVGHDSTDAEVKTPTALEEYMGGADQVIEEYKNSLRKAVLVNSHIEYLAEAKNLLTKALNFGDIGKDLNSDRPTALSETVEEILQNSLEMLDQVLNLVVVK